MPHPMQRVSNGRERRRLLCCARPRKQRALCSTESVQIAAIKKATVAAIDFKAAVRSAPTTSACLFFVLWMDARSRRGSRLCTERSGDDERLKSEHMFRPLYTACANAAVLSARGGRELRAVEAVELNRQQRGSRRDPHGASNLFFQVPPRTLRVLEQRAPLFIPHVAATARFAFVCLRLPRFRFGAVGGALLLVRVWRLD